MTTSPNLHPELGTPRLFKLQELLAPTHPLIVPDYQRDYSWGRKEYVAFWNDLWDFAFDTEELSNTYFLGAIVLVTGSPVRILDGQQRIATSTILLSCIADFFKSIDRNDIADDIIRKHIAEHDPIENIDTFYLTLNRYDRAYFKSLIGGKFKQHPSNPSHRNIRNCKRYFTQRLNAIKKEEGEEEAQRKAIRLLQTLRERVFLLAVTAFEYDVAADVFEKLNDRGIRLSTVDLVRSLLLQRSDDSTRETVLDIWGQILQLQDRANVDELLRYHWVTLEGDATTSRLYRVIRKRIRQRRQQKSDEAKYSPLEFTQSLARSAEIYNEIYTATLSDEVYSSVAATVVDLNVKPLIPLLLKIHSYDEALRSFIAENALNAFVRNRLIGKLSSTDFENEVYKIAQYITPYNVVDHIESLRRYTLSDEDFRRTFAVAELSVQKQSKYILRNIELFLRRKEHGHSGELTIGSSSQVHLDHVYPRKPEDIDRWSSHDEVIDRIGNHTLLASKPNRAAQNLMFEEKKTVFAESELIHTRKLADFEEWSPKHVDERQEWFAGLVAKIWTRPEPGVCPSTVK